MDKLKSFDKRFFLRVGSALLAFTAMISAFSAIAKKDWGLALGLGVVVSNTLSLRSTISED